MTEINPEPLVLTSQQGAIQIITLNRPEKSNALHPDLVNQLAEILEAVAGNQQVSVIVITGAGRSFSAGLDLELLLKWTLEEKLAYLDTVLPVFRRVWEMPQPVIAAVNGPAMPEDSTSQRSVICDSLLPKLSSGKQKSTSG